MSTEIELKLLITPSTMESVEKALLFQTEVKEQKVLFLGNTYYDTADKFFAQNKMGVRVRKENQQVTLTLKTGGRTMGGLHIRPEYNVSLANETPDLALLVEKYHLDPAWKTLQLQPIFATDFVRKTFQVCTALSPVSTRIEVAIDQGKILAGDKQAEIHEVEFELKQGEVADLLAFVRALPLETGIRLSAVSKAQCGYQLAENRPVQAQDWLDKWRDFLDFAQDTEKFTQKLIALFHLEQALIEETFALGQAYFTEDFLRTVERIGAFFNLYHFYNENAQALENAFNQQGLSEELKGNWLNLVESNQQCLAECKASITLHSESKNNTQVIASLFEFLQSVPYLHRMLDLLSLTYFDDTIGVQREEQNG